MGTAKCLQNICEELRMTGLLNLLHRIAKSRSGVAATEMALGLPFLLAAGLWGVETANLAIVHMRVNQLAVHVADNAARIGDTSSLEDRKIYEGDINDLLLGSNMQAGRALNFYDHGRTIISSLEVVDGTDDRQYIHWQRCKGEKVWASSYGVEGDGTDGSLVGMGPAGEEVMASPGDAVIFVEVAYEYQPLISERFIGDNTVKAIATFTVRDDRDLSQIFQRDPADPDAVASCAVHDDYNIVLG